MTGPEGLNERELRVLEAVVQAYIDTAEPTGLPRGGRLWQPGESYRLRAHSFALFINRAPEPQAMAQTEETGGGVAYMAHIGGFVAGLVLVKLFAAGRTRPSYA